MIVQLFGYLGLDCFVYSLLYQTLYWLTTTILGTLLATTLVISLHTYFTASKISSSVRFRGVSTIFEVIRRYVLFDEDESIYS